MFPLVIYRILCVACWLLCAGLQLCCAINKLKEEQTARINCTRTCAHLTKDLVRTQPSYEVRNTIRDHFSFTWMSCKFTFQTSFHCAFIMLLYYIMLIEKQTTYNSKQQSVKSFGDTSVNRGAQSLISSLHY